VARDGNDPVGAMALAVRYRGTMLRQVRWMGAPLSDYQDPVGCERRDECAAAFLAHLARERRRWDLCDLDGALFFHRKCPLVELPPCWNDYREQLSKNLRKSLGRRRRQIENAFGMLRLSTVADASALPNAMDDLIRLHNSRWRRRGLSGALAAKSTQAFHHEIARKFLGLGVLKLHRLMAGGECGATIYCFQRDRRVYSYLSGFRWALRRFSPATVLRAYAIERAIADGAREFDMLRGDEPYKYSWRAVDRLTWRLVVGHGSLASCVALDAHSIERWIEGRGQALQRLLRTAN
jgi:CelD/BcsL family acetyltransferase involved in cellulose biosynthesis